jgi:outer membrane protein W
MKKLILSIGLLSVWASAFAAESPWSVSINPGMAIPVGAAADLFKSGFAIDGSGEYAINEQFSAGLEAGYSQHNLEGTINGFAFTSNIDASLTHLTPYLKMGHTYTTQSFKIRPYVFAGLGYFHEAFGSGTINVDGFQLTTDGSSDDFSGINVGGGFDVPVTDHVSVGALFHYLETFEPGDDTKVITPSARIAYRF